MMSGERQHEREIEAYANASRIWYLPKLSEAVLEIRIRMFGPFGSVSQR
jgi:hypothetical protein